MKLFGTNLYVARGISATFGIGTLIFCMWTASRLKGRIAGFICGLSFVCNFVLVYNYTIVKTYALTSFFISLALWITTAAWPKLIRYPAATAALCLAAGTRMSLAPLAPLLLVYILTTEDDRWRLFSWSLASAAIAFGAVFLPAILPDPQVFLFNIFGAHVSDYGGASGMVRNLFQKLLTTEKLTRDFTFIIATYLAAICCFVWAQRGRLRTAIRENAFYAYLAASIVVVFFAHFIPKTNFHTYHVVNMPMAAVFASCVLTEGLNSIRNRIIQQHCIILLTLFIALSGYHRATAWFDPSLKNVDLKRVDELAAFLKQNTNTGDSMWSFDLPTAVHAGLTVPREMAMSVFCYYGDWSDEKAEKYHVTNRQFHESIVPKLRPKVVLLTSHDFSVNGLNPNTPSDQAKMQRSLLTALGTDYYLAKELEMPVSGLTKVYLRKN